MSAAIAILAMGLIVARRLGNRAGSVLVASSALCLVVGAATGGALGSRLRFWNEGHWYGARIAPPVPQPIVFPRGWPPGPRPTSC